MRYDGGSTQTVCGEAFGAVAGYGVPQYPVWDGAQPSGAGASVEDTALPPDEQLLSDCAQVRLLPPAHATHSPALVTSPATAQSYGASARCGYEGTGGR
jgi:hypothetical protein